MDERCNLMNPDIRARRIFFFAFLGKFRDTRKVAWSIVSTDPNRHKCKFKSLPEQGVDWIYIRREKIARNCGNRDR